ncbi:MAG: BON domain-containing protein, partial [Parvularculaceae bacterium]|nr:BON domain-containing protein [Parvularculaceae bacterium]
MRIALAALALFAAAGCASDRTLGGSVNAIGSEATLKSRLFADRDHDYGDVDLTLSQGRLLLTGTMRTEEGRAVLVERARTVKGVSEVIDSIVVGEKTTGGQGFEDGRIHEEVRTRWIARRQVDSRNFKMAVSQGVVYVIG